MKSKNIILSLLFLTQAIFASDQNKICPSGCGPIEHLLGKGIVRKYVQDNPSSGLVANYDDEGVPVNIVAAVTKFGLDINLIDNAGNAIVPRPFKDTGKMVLPMYLCPEFKAKQKVLATYSSDYQFDDQQSSDSIYQQLVEIYEFNQSGYCGISSNQINRASRK